MEIKFSQFTTLKGAGAASLRVLEMNIRSSKQATAYRPLYLGSLSQLLMHTYLPKEKLDRFIIWCAHRTQTKTKKFQAFGNGSDSYKGYSNISTGLHFIKQTSIRKTIKTRERKEYLAITQNLPRYCMNLR